MRKIELSEEQLSKLSLPQLYIIRGLKYQEFFLNIEELIMKNYPKAKNLQDAIEQIECGVVRQKHRHDNALVSVMHVITDFQTHQRVSRSTYRYEEQLEDVSDLKKYMKVTTAGPLVKSLRRNEMIIRIKNLFSQNEEAVYKAFNKERKYVEQVSEVVDNMLTEQKLKSYGIAKSEMKGFSLDEVKTILDVCDKQFEKTLSPGIIENVKSGLRKEDVLASVIPDKCK